MASRAILTPGLRICVQCQLRSAGLLPCRRIPTVRRTPVQGLLSAQHRRWATVGPVNPLDLPPPANGPAGPSGPAGAPPNVATSSSATPSDDPPPIQASTTATTPQQALHTQDAAKPTENEPSEPAQVEAAAPESAPPETTSSEPAAAETEPSESSSVAPTTSEPSPAASTTSEAPSTATESSSVSATTDAIPTTEASPTHSDGLPDNPFIPKGPRKKPRGLPQLENRRLLILELPIRRPRKPPAPNIEVEEEEVNLLSSNLLVFEQVADDMQLAISLVDPGVRKVSGERFQQIYDQLNLSFNRDQLSSFVKLVSDLPENKKKLPPVKKSLTKGQLCSLILKDIWKVQIDEEISAREDLIIQKQQAMSMEDIFFLIGENGRNLRQWAQQFHARITVSLRESFILVEATQVNLETLFDHKIPELLAQKIYEDIDLRAVARLAPFDKSYLPTISRLTGLISTELGTMLVPIEDARRLIFDSHELRFSTSYGLLVDSSFSPESEHASQLRGALFRVAEDSSLAWMLRSKAWYRWRSVKGAVPSSITSPEDQRIRGLIRDVAPAPDRAKQKEPAIAAALDALDALDAEGNSTATTEHPTQATSHPVEGMDFLKKMLDDNPQNKGPAHARYLPKPQYTATLGFILHNSKKKPGEADSLSAMLEEGPERVFCENIPGLTYLLAREPLAGKPEAKMIPPVNQWLPAGALSAVGKEAVEPETGIPAREEEKMDEEKEKEKEEEEIQDPARHTLLLHFSPSPWAHPDTFEQYPPVEMQVDVDIKTGEVYTPKVVAVYSNTVADLMLPARECDVRFRRRIVVPLFLAQAEKGSRAWEIDEEERAAERQYAMIGDESAGKEVEELGGWKPSSYEVAPHLPDQSAAVMEYLSKSHLNTQTAGRLQPAPKITLQIPTYLFDDHSIDPTSNADAKASIKDIDPSATHPVTYMFTSLTHNSTTMLAHKPFRLNKKVIEGGISGGKKLAVEVLARWLRVEGAGKKIEWKRFTAAVLGLVVKLQEKLGKREDVFREAGRLGKYRKGSQL
ncbi:hypothetical protein BDZ91DRAFT_848679 [Kalaharituber pfeilii]|nr:hypothetical protein BDZ91DRAFT_848679 [Kalaharituber pfeilii]